MIETSAASDTSRQDQTVKAKKNGQITLLSAGSEHPDTNIPFTAVIDGRQFSGSSLSLVSATISGLAGSELEGAERVVVLKFNFGAYAISVPVSAQVTRLKPKEGMLRLDFMEPTGEHLPALRYVLNSFVAGDVISLNGLINAREKTVPSNQHKTAAMPTVSQRLKQGLRFAATALATVALALVAGKLATDRLFSSEVAQLATASQGGEAMRALASGQIAVLNPAARKGEVVYAIRIASGDTLNVVMPCDCKAEIDNIAEGSTVLTGETIVRLARPGAPTLVEAVLTAPQVKKMLSGSVIELNFAGGTTKELQFVEGRDKIQHIPASENMRAIFKLDSAIPESAAHAPIAVRIVNERFFQLFHRTKQLLAQ
jgi:mannuronan synthase